MGFRFSPLSPTLSLKDFLVPDFVPDSKIFAKCKTYRILLYLCNGKALLRELRGADRCLTK